LEFWLETSPHIADAVQLLLDAKPLAVEVDGETSDTWQWGNASKVLVIRYQRVPKGTPMSVIFSCEDDTTDTD